MEKVLRVHWWDGSVVGHLVNRGAIYFVYDETWIKRGHNLSPLSLPFTDVAFNGSKAVLGLPGLISDCLPDSWGLKVARREFARNKWGEPDPMTLLAWRGTRGLGALQFLPVLQETNGSSQLESISAEALARGAAEIERGEPAEVLSQLAKGGTAGGAYPKALVLFYEDGTLRVGKPDGRGKPCLLKFDLSQGGENAACEHVYALMAKLAGIRAVETRLIEDQSPEKRRHLLVERFDVSKAKDAGHRSHFHSVSGLLHKEPGDLDYRDLFRSAIRLAVPAPELRELARRMVFNVLASNHDDHGKNHAFLYDEDRREWTLTPAYDMTYGPGVLERGMLIVGEVWPEAKTMEDLCLQAGLRLDEARAIFEQVKAAMDQWPDLAQQAGISAGLIREISDRHLRIRSRVWN